MRIFDKYTLIHDACITIKLTAECGIWNGVDYDAYFERCRFFLEGSGARIIFTKEVGYHTSGWWKNPDYERCYHLSLSFLGGTDRGTSRKILAGLFHDYEHLIWAEPPYYPEGKEHDVWHYRLFCDEHWNPIKPRGEVYSTQFTERGWKSFSELHFRK